MAKGMYSVICYLEDLQEHHLCIGDILYNLRQIGGEAEFILHDKDVKEDGTPAKPHYHINMGWESHFPSWRDFVEFQKANFCMSPEPRRKSDPPGKRYRKYYEPTARVRDVQAIHRYLTHGHAEEEEG